MSYPLVDLWSIGKTSLALKVIQSVYSKIRYEAVIWLSARDVDLQFTGPRAVRPAVLTPRDMSWRYASLVLSMDKLQQKGFDPQAFFEQELQKSHLGACLFVFDNFETIANPVDTYTWIDSYIRLPNKALITTRLRDFKGDYPVEVRGMEDMEARQLANQVADSLGISDILNADYISDLIDKSEGHPYVIKILLGEVAKLGRAASVPHMVAGTEDILNALFERTYATLSPCAQRAFLTLSAWNSLVPRIALEAVLFTSTEERYEVEKGIESLLQYSLAEIHFASSDNQEYISLPLVASVFGKRKLNISPSRAVIQADVKVLQMLGASRSDELHTGLYRQLDRFMANVSKRIEAGESYHSYKPILESICRAYNAGWLLLGEWLMELRTLDGYEQAKEALRRFLENDSESSNASKAWKLLGHACYQTGDALGEIHAFIERGKDLSVPFYDLSNTANRLNLFLGGKGETLDREQKRYFATRILAAMDKRRSEATPDDLSRMGWLAIRSGQEHLAREYVEIASSTDPGNYHIQNLRIVLGMTSA